MKTPERVRREFEEWCKSKPDRFFHLARQGDGYWLPRIQTAWLAWREQERRIEALVAAVRGELDREDGDA